MFMYVCTYIYIFACTYVCVYLYIFLSVACTNNYVCNRFSYIIPQITSFILLCFYHLFLFIYFLQPLNGYDEFARSSEVVEKQKVQMESTSSCHRGKLNYLPAFERETAI